MQNKRKMTLMIAIAVVAVLAIVLSLPPVRSRVIYYSRVAYRTVKYWIKPPNEAVFVPSNSSEGQAAGTPAATPTQPTPTATPGEPSATPTQAGPQATATPGKPTATPTQPPPTATATPLPASVLLKGVTPELQDWNNCGPATLSMYLSFYDWGQDQYAAAAVLKPYWDDRNVMPRELADFVNNHTDMQALWRYGADLQTIRVLLNAGFPVMIERGYEPQSLRDDAWMGHYNLVVGYDDERETVTVHDSYFNYKNPWGVELTQDMLKNFYGFDFYYSELEQTWRAFNNVIIVVYPPEKENDVLQALGPLADEKEANRITYERAVQETTSLTDERDRIFAWWNVGVSLEALQDHQAAAEAFDTAFALLEEIDRNERPYRLIWYSDSPYSAYYYSERYQDVVNLWTYAQDTIDEGLEERYYWRALAYIALGDTNKAVADLRTSLKYHEDYAPSVEMLKNLGKTP